MRKLTFRSLFILGICFVILSGCSGQSLSDDFDEEAVKNQAKEVIMMINNKNSEDLMDISTVQMKEALTPETVNTIFAAIDEGGEFIDFEDISVGGQKDESSDEEFAVVVVNTNYDIKNFTYTISFTKQMKMAGLYYK